MIGVVSNPEEGPLVREFFELFKTPWEFYHDEGIYDVILSTTGTAPCRSEAKLILVYGGGQTPYDMVCDNSMGSSYKTSSKLTYRKEPLPLYGSSVRFAHTETTDLQDAYGASALLLRRSGNQVSARIGYELFQEVRALLTSGQPVAEAGAPTLDTHVAVLRDLMIESGVEFVEIPPSPEGYRFIACLTHDVDHPSIRFHKFDSTALGFLYRAVIGSVLNKLRSRISSRQLLHNWYAALKLPFVYLGVAKDFWRVFAEYLTLEKGMASSFFVIPFKGRPGRISSGLAPKNRASGYGAAQIAADIRSLTAFGAEVGVHGIDAWTDSASGKNELNEIGGLTGKTELGIRMHWLYFDAENSPMELEQAGFQYDSTVGYNETVGYRAGTNQVYKPLNVDHLLELPLHIMDTALFYPARLHLSPVAARSCVTPIVNNAAHSGGTVTVNWHDRSIAPERLWGDFYKDLLAELESNGAWFATAAEAVAWFRGRRAIRFELEEPQSDRFVVKTGSDKSGTVPGYRLRVYNAPGANPASSSVQDVLLRENVTIRRNSSSITTVSSSAATVGGEVLNAANRR
jgi:hypothetical protein